MADPRPQPAPSDAPPEGDDTVVCFVSGSRIPRDHAVRVKIGRGQRVWIQAEYCQPAEDRRL